MPLDVEAHLVESAKRTARPPSAGLRGYQPWLVEGAETGLVLADEFRDGNVPASRNMRELVDEADATLPARAADDAWPVRVRSDSAASDPQGLDPGPGRGWRFAVSADRSPQLRRELRALEPDAWHFGAQAAKGGVREWAEGPFGPSRAGEQRDTAPYRYLAIRVRTPQGVLFGDGHTVKHVAVVTKDWETDGQTLLTGQRGKAGTIEHVNYLLKDELAAGVYPSEKFGANAAWRRLPGLTHPRLEWLTATARDPPSRRARPKRWRFAIFTPFGRVGQPARQGVLRLVTRTLDPLLRPGWRRLRACAWPLGP